MEDIQMRATGNSFRELCPYCHSRFSEHEDLVFCAQCEAKHHQECWSELGSCSACRNEHNVQDLLEPEVLTVENLEDRDVGVVKKRRVREKDTNSMAFGLILIIVICAMIPIGFLLLVAAMF